MAQKIELRNERPLQTYWLKNFLAVNTVAARITLPQDSCFYDLTNAQPIGFSNLHSIADATAPLHDFGSSRVYKDWSMQLSGVEVLVIATTDGKLWVYYQGYTDATGTYWPPAVTQINGTHTLSGTDSLDIAQYSSDSIVIIDSTGYYYWTPVGGAGGGGTRETPILPVDPSQGAPTSGSAIAVYNNQVWIAQGRKLFYSVPGVNSTNPPGTAPAFENFTLTAGGGWELIVDSTLRSDITALFAANGYLYVFGISSVDAISNVSTTASTDTAGITTATTNYTRLNVSAYIGTDQGESIMVYGRLVFFANHMGVWMLYGYEVVSASTDANNGYYSGIDGTWQYLDFNHYNDAVQWINRAGDMVDWQNSAGNIVQWKLNNYTPFLFKISGGQVMSNNMLCAAFLVVRKNDPIMGSGNFLVMYQGDATGQNYKWWFADWTSDIGPITHACTSYVNGAPALFGYIGNKLYQFFADKTTAPSARVMTALWDFGDPLVDKQALRAGIRVSLHGAANPAMSINIDTLISSYPIPLADIGIVDWNNATEQRIAWQSAAPQTVRWNNLRNFMIYYGKAPECFSKYLGFTARSQRGTLFELNSFLLDYKTGARWVGD